MGLASLADPLLNVLAELPSGRVRRLAFEQSQFLFQFFGFGLDMGQAGLAVLGMNCVIRGVSVGDQGPLKALAQDRLGAASAVRCGSRWKKAKSSFPAYQAQ